MLNEKKYKALIVAEYELEKAMKNGDFEKILENTIKINKLKK